MQTNIPTLFFEFPLSDGPYGFCDHGGVSIVPQTIAFGVPDNIIRRQKPSITPAVEERMAAIVATMISMAKEIGIETEEIAPLDHGKQGVAYLLDQNHITRIQLGKLDQRPDKDWLLQPDAYHYDKDLDVTFEIMPKVIVGNVSPEKIQALVAEVRQEGWTIWDTAPQNFTLNKDERPVLVDPDAFCKIR